VTLIAGSLFGHPCTLSPRLPDGLDPRFAVSLTVGAQLVLPLVFAPVGNGEAVLWTKGEHISIRIVKFLNEKYHWGKWTAWVKTKFVDKYK
jgi:hypothetical protein